MLKESFFKIYQKLIFSDLPSPRKSFINGEDVHQFVGKDDSPSEKAHKILGQMTLEEKIDFIGGLQWFAVRPLPRLGLDRCFFRRARRRPFDGFSVHGLHGGDLGPRPYP